MKRFCLLFGILCSFFGTQAQNGIAFNRDEKKNEVKLNVISPVLGGIEMSYERILNEKSGLGISALQVFTDANDEDKNYMISTYYRRYFGKKQASGFFAEGFGTLSSIDGKQLVDKDGNGISKEASDVMDFSLGIGVGSKWVTKKGFVFEVNLGWGKLLFNAVKTDHNQIVRMGVNLGYKF